LQLALGTSAIGGLDTLVLAIQLLAHRRALGVWGGASGVALRRSTDGLTMRAGILFTFVSWATNAADWSFAVNHTLGARSLFTSHLALGASANRVANSRAAGVITLPSALRVALASSDDADEDEQGQSNQRLVHFCPS